MASPLALSVLSEVGDLIDRFGAYAGFAAILGLALLTLLYIAQARELKRLREWAGQMPERVGDLQGRIAPAEPSRVTPAPAPRLRPNQPATPAAQAAGQVLPAATVPPSTAAAEAPATEALTTVAGEQPDAPAGTEAALPLVPGKTGSDGAKVAGAEAAAAPEAARPVNPLERARQPQTARAAGQPASPQQRQRGPLIAAAVAAAAVLALIVYFIGFSGDDGGTKTRSTSAKPVAPATTSTRATEPTAKEVNARTSVFVLNGTTITGLARGLANTLEQKGYTIKGTATAPDQTRSATLVLFAPGKRADALRVARSINKGSDVVQPVDSGSAALGQGAAVVILVGADQNVTNPG